ncbi:MAG: hypothetical protein RL272_726 [Candidatus Parcubacteria bacterium]
MDTPRGAAVASPIAGPKKVSQKVLLLAKLAERFLPAVDALLRPKAKTGIAALMGLITQRSPEVRDLIVSLEDGTARPMRAKAFAACGLGLHPRTVGALVRKVDWSVVDAVESATFTLVLGWLDTFPKPQKGMLAIDTGTLDEAMLPPLDTVRAERFRECCSRVCLSEMEVRGILCAVRGSLPPGDVIPEEAAMLLGADLITFIR